MAIFSKKRFLYKHKDKMGLYQMMHRQCFSPTLNLLNGIKADARNDYRTIGNTNRALFQNYFFENPGAFCRPCPPPCHKNNNDVDLMSQFMQTMLFMKLLEVA